MAKLTHKSGQSIIMPDDQVKYFTDLGWIEQAEDSADEPDTVDIPEGEPSEDWTLKQLTALAEKKSVDLSGVKPVKKDVVAAIAAKTAE